MANDKDLYQVLGVTKGAPDDELRSAYRKLARKNHPDVNQGDKLAEERFKEISAAYDVLSNPEKRKLYDEFGHVGLRDGFDAQKARAYEQFGRGQTGKGAWPGGGMGGGGQGPEFDLSDLFGDWFGGGGAGGGAAGGRRPTSNGFGRGRDLSALVEIDFVQAINGCEVSLQMPAQAACARCLGSGRVGGVRGTTCAECSGSGRIPRAEVLTVRIPSGADQGSKLRVGGRGEPGQNGAAPGDLLIETRIRAHPHFTRDGLHLILRLPVTLDEAYNGTTVSVPTPSGPVNLRIPKRSQPKTRLRLKGRGVERAAKAGDLFVDLDVRLPDGDDEAVAEAMRQANAGYKKPVRAALAL